MIDRLTQCVYNLKKMNRNLQGEVRFLTGGKAHEPKGMIRCNSEADSIVWMKEDNGDAGTVVSVIPMSLWNGIIPEFCFARGTQRPIAVSFSL